MKKIVLTEKLKLIAEFWEPAIIGDFNDQYVKLAKFKGTFIWHEHNAEDELFFVLKGILLIEFEDSSVSLKPGEMLIVPKGTKHRPIANGEVHVLLIEPKTTINTGEVISSKTKTKLKKV